MIKKRFLLIFCLLFLLARGFSQAPPQDLKEIKLSPPNTESGRPLMQCLRERKSSREFSTEKLSAEVLSNLLWAADGVNRPDSGKRTAPSAVNWQNIDIYVTTAEGLFIYQPQNHSLKQILTEDIQAITGKQDFVKNVPVNLIFVADLSRINRGTDEEKRFYSAAHTGFISQNVYLFCASEGLSTVVRGMIDREAMARAMKLRPDQQVIFAQSVGYPKK